MPRAKFEKIIWGMASVDPHMLEKMSDTKSDPTIPHCHESMQVEYSTIQAGTIYSCVEGDGSSSHPFQIWLLPDVVYVNRS